MMREDYKLPRTAQDDLEGGSNVTKTGQARALDSLEILAFLEKELAIPLSSLSERFQVPQDKMRSAMESLATRGLVRVQGILDSPGVIYSITEDGARLVESRVKKGVSAFF